MKTLLSRKFLVLTLIARTGGATCASSEDTSAPVMTLVFDEKQAARRIAFVREEIRVRSKMALFNECMQGCALKMLDSADIV